MKVVHIPHERKLSFTDTAECLTTQTHLLPTRILAELQYLHGLNTHEEFKDVDCPFEEDGLTVTNNPDQNFTYDAEMNSDAAAKWLRMAGL